VVYWNIDVGQGEESRGNSQSILTKTVSFFTPVIRLTRTATDPPGSIFYWRHVDQGNTGTVNLCKLITFLRT